LSTSHIGKAKSWATDVGGDGPRCTAITAKRVINMSIKSKTKIQIIIKKKKTEEIEKERGREREGEREGERKVNSMLFMQIKKSAHYEWQCWIGSSKKKSSIVKGKKTREKRKEHNVSYFLAYDAGWNVSPTRNLILL